MKRLADSKPVRFFLWLVLGLFGTPRAWGGVYQHGTVIRMRMSDCLSLHHGFREAMAGAPAISGADVCPEYTLISDKVVFVIVGKSSGQLIPLADIVDFRLNKNELALRVDDAKHESKFTIKEMILRSDWDVIQKHIAEQMNGAVQQAGSIPPRQILN